MIEHENTYLHDTTLKLPRRPFGTTIFGWNPWPLLECSRRKPLRELKEKSGTFFSVDFEDVDHVRDKLNDWVPQRGGGVCRNLNKEV